MAFNNNNYSRQEDKSESKPAVEIKSFYETGSKNLQKDLFDKTALDVAESFVGKDNKGKTVGVSSTQLRRIFDEVKRFERLINDDNSFSEQLPYIKMIKSKVAYNVARAVKKKSSEKDVYRNLEKFLFSCIDCVKAEKDYHIFVALFEAVYGFYYEKAPKEN